MTTNMHQKRGFTMLIAVVTGTILLLIAYGMASIALKQQVLNATARESAIAFYAADSALDCALYLDTVYKAFAVRDTDTEEDLFKLKNDSSLIADYCGESVGSNEIVNTDFKRILFSVGAAEEGGTQVDIDDYEESFMVKYPNDICATVTIKKERVEQNQIRTSFDARGYNTCRIDSPRRLERGIEAWYEESFNEVFLQNTPEVDGETP